MPTQQATSHTSYSRARLGRMLQALFSLALCRGLLVGPVWLDVSISVINSPRIFFRMNEPEGMMMTHDCACGVCVCASDVSHLRPDLPHNQRASKRREAAVGRAPRENLVVSETSISRAVPVSS